MQLTMRGFYGTHPGSLHITTLHGSLILLGVWPRPDPLYFAHWFTILSSYASISTFQMPQVAEYSLFVKSTFYFHMTQHNTPDVNFHFTFSQMKAERFLHEIPFLVKSFLSQCNSSVIAPWNYHSVSNESLGSITSFKRLIKGSNLSQSVYYA